MHMYVSTMRVETVSFYLL